MSAETVLQFQGNDLSLRHLRSNSFITLYRRVMKHVEDLAYFLDKDGRAQSKLLSPAAARDYAALSRQLTAGALRIASAMLTLRSVRDGDVSFTSGMADIRKQQMTESPGGFTGSLEGLPQGILDLAIGCDTLRLEVVRLVDAAGSEGRSGMNPVHAALGRIGLAFGA
jgi:regulator of CtrA degradation